MWYKISLLVGLILLGASIYFLKNRLAFVQKAEKTNATLVEYALGRKKKGRQTYIPIFKFKTLTNEEITYSDKSSSTRKPWAIGEEIKIAYDPTDPSNAKLLTYLDLFPVSIFLAAFAFPFIVIGAGYFWSQKYFRSLEQSM
jgi:Protein of unknown function (DUF3592)